MKSGLGLTGSPTALAVKLQAMRKKYMLVSYLKKNQENPVKGECGWIKSNTYYL